MRWLEQELEKLKREGLYRERVLPGNLRNFCSNDYLGLRGHPEVIEEALKVLKEEGLGSGASQLVSGYGKYHRKLEERLAEFKKTPACVLFGSGYLANVGVIPILAGEGDLILSDELNHASIIDGVRLSRAEKKIFRHRDYEHLEELLKEHRKNYRRVLVITDTVFSMDGDIADLRKLYRLSEEYDFILYLDEAHATGTIGKGGPEYFGLPFRENVVLMGTLSKALGSYGAFVCGSETLIRYIVNRARSLIFSTSLPPALCAGALKALELIEREDLPRKLRKKEKGVVGILQRLGLDFSYHGTPIIPILLYEETRALRVSERLKKEGVLIRAIRYPTVPRKKARLRLTVSLSYSEEDLKLLEEALKKVLKEGERR